MSQNQKVLAKRIDSFETSFSTHLATVEESLSTILSIFKVVLQRVRGPTPPSEDCTTLVPSPPTKHSKLSVDEPLKQVSTSPTKPSSSQKEEKGDEQENHPRGTKTYET